MTSKLAFILEIYKLAAAAVVDPDILDKLSDAQRVQLRTYWNEINVWMTYYKPVQTMPDSIQNRVFGGLQDMAKLLSPPPAWKQLPLNIMALHLEQTQVSWTAVCNADGSRDTILKLFQQFDIPLPQELDSLSEQQLCELLAHSWPHNCMNGWKPDSVLGQGHEGVVYVVCQLDSCAAVAKMSLTQPYSSAKFSPLEREMYIQKAAGPTIAPKVLDFFACDAFMPKKWDVLVMDRHHGTLKQLIQSGKLGFVTMQKIYEQLVSMIFELSSRGITHRDLHTENILYSRVDDSLRFYITDFGFAYMESLGFWNKDLSAYKRYAPTKVNPHYDLAFLLRDLRLLTNLPYMQLPLSEYDSKLTNVELVKINDSLRS